ncbi:MAG: histidine phosphatase family protein [Phycisphaerales bacterium]|nr:histidine phosphatase family protein [Planctomycetota bacterium]MCH8507614.1 histidine phosphatase family protein [Phycisphaerales bacterium]
MPKPTSVRLVLLSAAPTAWDEAGRLIGQAALPATDGGTDSLHQRAKAFVQAFDGELDLVLCGPEDSTRASAALLAEAAGCKLRQLNELANVNLGLWEGSLREELEGRCPSTYKAWRDQPDRIRPPEGEAIGDAAARAMAVIRKALDKARTEQPVIGVVVRPLLWAALLSRLNEEPWGSYWTLADQAGEIRCLTRPIADLNPEAISASA